MLDLAARIAARARGRAEPNPLVGCVIANPAPDQSPTPRVIGLGHHRVFGDIHAEVDASARRQGLDHLLPGSTAYVTLEPCNHTGKQPPCTRALLAARVGRVIFARHDPNPLAAGGCDLLRSSGIACELCSDSPNALALSRGFVKRTTLALPWTIAKWAQTLDAHLAYPRGVQPQPRLRITGPRAACRVHALRARVDAIITTIDTVLADRPLLTTRHAFPRRTPLRVILDRRLQTPLDTPLVQTAGDPTAGRVVLLTTPDALSLGSTHAHALASLGVSIEPILTSTPADLALALKHLANAHNTATVLVESGPRLLSSLLSAGLADELHVFTGPLTLRQCAERDAISLVASQPALSSASNTPPPHPVLAPFLSLPSPPSARAAPAPPSPPGWQRL